MSATTAIVPPDIRTSQEAVLLGVIRRQASKSKFKNKETGWVRMQSDNQQWVYLVG
jgi:hypothetical protein